MQTAWMVTNPASGSTSVDVCTAIEAALADIGAMLAGRTAFPEAPLPTAVDLDAAGVDTLILFAGDGTINAAIEAVRGWPGNILILPGGTMNLLAKVLHGNADPLAIIHASAQLCALPYVAIGEARAFVAAIIGPAAHWHRPRELARASRFRSMARAVRLAWRASFDRGIRVSGSDGPKGRHQAVIVTPKADGLDVAAVDARRWGDIVRLGWDYATGDWLNAPSVTHWRDREIAVLGRRGVLALIDGEPMQLVPPQRIGHGMSAPVFLATLESPA
jgi:diacylglycerol kinase family enzyme